MSLMNAPIVNFKLSIMEDIEVRSRERIDV